MKDKKPGIRCANCGARLDSGERCDCEQYMAEHARKQREAKRRTIITHNMEMIAQAEREWMYR